MVASVTLLEHKKYTEDTKPEVYHYRECGLDDIWLRGGFSFEDEGGELCLFVEDQEDLHKAMALSIIERGDRITGRELRFLRHELNLTQDHLARLLETDVQSVARWEKGKSKTPGPADRLIRFLYLRKLEKSKDVLELLETLAELDRLTNAKQYFERTPTGWRKAA